MTTQRYMGTLIEIDERFPHLYVGELHHIRQYDQEHPETAPIIESRLLSVVCVCGAQIGDEGYKGLSTNVPDRSENHRWWCQGCGRNVYRSVSSCIAHHANERS